MYDLLIIGAGPGGIALAAEAGAAGISRDKILVLERLRKQIDSRQIDELVAAASEYCFRRFRQEPRPMPGRH